MGLEELEERVGRLESRVSNIESDVNQLAKGLEKINESISEIKTILVRQSTVNEYMKDIFVTRKEFQEALSGISNSLTGLQSRMDTADRMNESFWDKYGHIIATLALIASIIAIILRRG